MKFAGKKALDEMIHGWVTCLQKGPPYLFPGDSKEALHPVTFRSHKEFIQSRAFGYSDDTRAHLWLIPQPYIGNLKTARLILLSLNPGFSHGEYVYDKNKRFKQVLCSNIKQELGGHDFPFIFLNPGLAWHSGFSYWVKHLQGLIQAIREEEVAGSFYEALMFLAQRIACIELYPYHSRKSPSLNYLNLASSQLAINLVHQVLAPRIASKQCVVLALRKAKIWKQKGCSVKIHEVNSAQAATISKKNSRSSAWSDILRVLNE